MSTAEPVRYFNAYLQDDAHLVALSRGPDGSLKRHQVPAEWVAYYLAEEVTPELQRMLRSTSYVRSVRPEGRWLRVGYAGREARRLMVEDERSPLRLAGVRSYEGDVHPAARWAADTGALVAKARRAYVDIETDSRVPFADAVEGAARVLAVAVVDEQGARQSRVLAEETDDAEEELLAWFWGVVGAFDQVSAWNGDAFDFPILAARSRRLRLPVNMNHWVWICQMEAFERLNTASESGDEKRSLALEAIGQAVLKRGKLVAPDWAQDVVLGRSMGAAAYDLWAAGGRHRALLEEYNVEDTDLLRLLEAKLHHLDLFQTICEACSIFANTRGLNPTAQMDGFMLKLGLQKGEHFGTKVYVDGPAKKFKGAFVMEPKAHGIVSGVHVCDFKSLYPSIILSWNMSPETKRTDLPPNGPVAPGTARTPTGVSFDLAREGILVTALRELLRLRDHWKKVKAQCSPGTPEWHDANRMTTTYKVLANSFYGVLSSVWSRFCDVQIGEGITQTAKWLILRTIEAAGEYGLAYGGHWRAIYADTDSAYIHGPTEEQFRAFTAWCNEELYPKLLREQGCRENQIKLAYEKEYERLVFVAAKNYAGSYAHADGVRATAASKPEIKGLAYVRGDVIKMAAELQAECIDMAVGGLRVAKDGPVPTLELQRYRALVERAKKRVLEGPLVLDEIKKSQALSQPLRDYAVRTRADGQESRPAHVEVACILKARGQEVREGTRIEYVVTDASVSPMKVIPAEDYTGAEADRYYLWENLVYPPTLALLEAAFPLVDATGRMNPDHEWKRYLRARPKKDRHALPGQTGLFGGKKPAADAPPAFVDYALAENGADAEGPAVVDGDTRVSPPASRELHVTFASGDDASMLDLDGLLRHYPGDEPLGVEAWVVAPEGRQRLGPCGYLVDFAALAGDRHLRALLGRLGGRFAA